MSKIIDEGIVRKVAKLARLSLSSKDEKKFSDELSLILGYVEKLKEINTDNVEPTSHAVSNVKNVFRIDRTNASISVEEALKNSPKRIKDFFGVPKIIE